VKTQEIIMQDIAILNNLLHSPKFLIVGKYLHEDLHLILMSLW
jgi:hypothetical protein